MSGFHILTPGWSSGASASANSQASPDVSAANLFAIQPSQGWRSAGLGTLQVILDAGSPRPWNAVAVLFHNGSDGNITFKGDDDVNDLFPAPSYSSGAVPLLLPGNLSSFASNHTWFVAGSTQTTRYIGLEISDDNNPDGYFQAGVVMVGQLFTPQIGVDIGAKFGYDDPSPKKRLFNGEAIVRPKRVNSVGSFRFPKQNITDSIRWLEINKIYGSKVPMVLKWDPFDAAPYEQYFIYYGFAEWRNGGAISYVNAEPFYDVELAIEEV